MNWEDVGGDGREMAVWVCSQSNGLQEILESVILQGGRFSSRAWQAPDAAALLASIAQDPRGDRRPAAGLAFRGG